MPEQYIYDEKNVLERLSQGSELAFAKLYETYSARLFGNLLKMTKSETVAQEILQEVFITIWDNRQSIDPEKSFRSYLFKIAENKVYDFLRKAVRDKKLHTQILATTTIQYTHIEEKLLAKENISMVQSAIKALSPQRQQVFRLCKMEGKSYEEVSTLLGISTSTISDHIVKATRSIHQYIDTTYGVTTCILLLFFLAGI
jgi:RNA polymerase sigma-70 factor (ECF subfamily)